MKTVKIAILLIVSYINLGFALHPFHASITQLRHNEEEQLLEITVKLFTDDLGKAIGEEILIGDELSELQSEQIGEYVRSNFKIKDLENNKTLNCTLIGEETEYDITFIYLEIKDFKLSKAYEISQTVLFDQFEDQSNIVNFLVDKETYSDYFTPTSTQKTFDIK
tara:strand:- start:4045 stop:4539 length:495 start_codon:yes stop_codon:yes gene_type:complete